MCKNLSKLKFCTCLDVKDQELINIHKRLDRFLKKKLPKSKKSFSWVLYEYLGTEESDLMGLLHMPSHVLASSLTEEIVIEAINSENCFDFEYQPKEGDNLQINYQRNKYWGEFMSFIYRDNEWKADSYYTFTEKIEPKNFGILNVFSEENNINN